MNYKEDILQKIESDFKESGDKAIELLDRAILKANYIRTDRVIRCILFLAKGDLKELNKFIELAISDTRDVMFWAEYEILAESNNYRRVRDFNKTFDKCTSNVKQ